MSTPASHIQPIDVDPYARRSYPPQDDNLVNLIENWESYQDRLIIFLGAGASVGARNTQGVPLPAAFHLRNEIWREFMLSPSEKYSFDFSNLGLMTLEHAAALIEAKLDTKTLKTFVASYFIVARSLWQHAVLRYLKPKAVLTDNQLRQPRGARLESP